MHALLWTFWLLQFPADSIRQQEQTVAIHRSGLPVRYDTQPTELSPYLKQVKARRLEDRFDQLLLAVEAFSLAYKGSRGRVRPAGKAEALRKAMLELQKADPAFGPKANPRR